MTQYNNIQDKNISSGQPMYVAYDPGSAQQAVNIGTLSVYYPPNETSVMYLETDCYLSEFVNISDTVNFEPAYYEAIIYNLAVRLFRFYRDINTQIPPDMAMIATNSMTNLKTMNSVTLQAGMELPGKVSKYNIFTDGD